MFNSIETVLCKSDGTQHWTDQMHIFWSVVSELMPYRESLRYSIKCIFVMSRNANWIKIILYNWLKQAPEALSLMINPPVATSRFCISNFANVNLIKCKSIIFCTRQNSRETTKVLSWKSELGWKEIQLSAITSGL